MRADLDELFAAVRRDTADSLLASPADLRGIGDRRTRTKRIVVSAAAVVAILVGVGVGLAYGLPGRNSGPAGPTPSASTGPTQAPTTPSSAPVAGAACTATDLTVTPDYFTGAAAGSLGTSVTVVNSGSRTCTLSGDPTLWYDRSGTLTRLPATPGGSSEVRLAPGHGALFSIMRADGYGGFTSAAPQCAHPYTYRGLQMGLPDGSRRALPNLSIPVTCGDISLLPWQATIPEVPNSPCTASLFGPAFATGNSAAGLLAFEISFTYEGNAACQLPALATVTYQDPTTGTRKQFGHGNPYGAPLRTTPLVVHQGDQVSFPLSEPDGLNFTPIPPTCAHPVTYLDVAIEIGNGSVPVSGQALSFNCTGPTVGDWKTGQ